jgi:hypothetical protein
LVVALCLWPGLALGEGAMTAEDFAAFSTGKTVTYESEGVLFGREEYRAGRQVVWQSGAAGVCEYGQWFEGAPGEICFDYGGGPICWRFQDRAGQVSARSVQAPDAPELFATGVVKEPLVCLGPEVGV